ncbi:MAG: hypothetical protein HFJ47_00190 [Clostridia bacterium]|nr:hypothetical protein [Clostridia bacterium]
MNKFDTTIVGYHGTENQSANLILSNNKYNKSNNEDDWLGSGIYFYDNLENAILYNIRNYINKNKIYPKYVDLIEERVILVNVIKCKEDEIVDLNEFENLRKFLGLWKIFYDKVKNDEEYKKLKLKDGYMINWLYENTIYFKGCKIFKNVFNLDLRFKRNISKIFNKKTRIGYNLNQIFICVVDDSCIKSIRLYESDYEKEFEIIKDVTNNILMGMGEKSEI